MTIHIPSGVDCSSSLLDRLTPLCHSCLDAWHTARPEVPRLGPTTTRWQRWRNAHATGRLIDEIATRVDEHPENTTAQRAWREALRNRLQDFGERRFGWPDGYRRLLFGDAFYDASVAFARQARVFDPALRLDDLWQALRNVWIGNNLQMLLGRPVRLTRALFAYSMLYPVTDNLLDAPDRSADDKRTFNARLGLRLLGNDLTALYPAEAAAFHLVGQIEEEFPRHEYGNVWESILAIHRGQISSLRQQGPPPLSEEELCEISFAKGGASVLADMYLVVGEATPSQERFAFGYGAFLQLLDDLQDVTVDIAVGHQTLFTLAVQEGALDDLTARLVDFIDVVLNAERTANEQNADCLDLIRRNCHSMLAGVVAENPAMFGRPFRRVVESQWPLSFRAMRRLRRRAQHRFQRTAQRLQVRRGVSSPLELLLANP